MKNYMTEAEWIKAEEEFEDDMTVKEFREARIKIEKQEKDRRIIEEIEKLGKPYELPYIDLF